MRLYGIRIQLLVLLATVIICSLTACISAAKMDKFVGNQYGNQLPKIDKKKKADINVTASFPPDSKGISTTRKSMKLLPLIVYWKWKYSTVCTLNQGIAFAGFSNTVNSMATKGLAEKLNGRHLELNVEQVPSKFALVDKGGIVLFFQWDRVYVEADKTELIVTYNLMEGSERVKSGKVIVKNGSAADKTLRIFQSWRSATSEHIMAYNADITAMSKAFVTQLMTEL